MGFWQGFKEGFPKGLKEGVESRTPRIRALRWGCHLFSFLLVAGWAAYCGLSQ